MSLKAFHLLFISASMGLALLVAVWGFTHGAPVLAGFSVAGGVVLMRYQSRFLEKARRLGLK